MKKKVLTITKRMKMSYGWSIIKNLDIDTSAFKKITSSLT